MYVGMSVTHWNAIISHTGTPDACAYHQECDISYHFIAMCMVSVMQRWHAGSASEGYMQRGTYKKLPVDCSITLSLRFAMNYHETLNHNSH